MNTIIEKIRAEIERRKNYISVTHFAEELLSRLSDLEKEEKPTPAEGLEEEIERYLSTEWKLDEDLDKDDYIYGCTLEDLKILARYFYELSQQSRPKISDNSLDEEIAGMYQALFGTDIINRKERLYLDTFEAIARHFAQWGVEHAKKCEEKPNKVKADFDIYRFQQKFCIHCEIPHCAGTIDYLKSCPYLNK